MTKKLYTEASIQDVADAIREKGVSGTFTIGEMGDAVRSISLDVVNGMIEQYKAHATTVSPNTFVEFVNGSLADAIAVGDGTVVATPAFSADKYTAATALDDSRVFIAYGADASNTYIYGAVCTINGSTITVGSAAQLSMYGDASPQYLSVAALSDEAVFVAHRYGDHLWGVACSINGTTITPGTDIKLSTGFEEYYYHDTSVVALDASTVFIAHRNGTALDGMVCTINGTTISPGTDTHISTVAYSFAHASAVLVGAYKVFIAHKGSSDNELNGVVCTISGTTITVGTDITIASGTYVSSHASAVRLTDDKVFVAHNNGSSAELKGVVCTISGTTITAGADTTIASGTDASLTISATALDENTVFIAHSLWPGETSATRGSIYGVVCTISGTGIVPGTDTMIATGVSNPSAGTYAVTLSENKVFIIHNRHPGGEAQSIVGRIVEGEKTIQASVSKIEGLTRGQATTSTAGDTWVLDPNYSS